MSTDPSAIIQSFPESISVTYSTVAAVVVLVYDTLLSLPDEIEYIWCRKFSLVGTILYLLTRYGTVLQFTSSISQVFISELTTGRVITALPPQVPPNQQWIHAKSCSDLEKLFSVMSFVSDVAASGLLLARACAVCANMPVIKCILLLLFFISQAIDAVLASIELDCLGSLPEETARILGLTRSTSLILFDSAILLATLYNMYNTRKKMPANDRTNFLTMLFSKQELFEFVVIAIWIISPFLSGTDLQPENSLAAVLMCHFVIQLRQFGGSSLAYDSLGSIPFRQPHSAIGNIVTCMVKNVILEFGNHSKTASTHPCQTDIETRNLKKSLV